MAGTAGTTLRIGIDQDNEHRFALLLQAMRLDETVVTAAQTTAQEDFSVATDGRTTTLYGPRDLMEATVPEARRLHSTIIRNTAAQPGSCSGR